MPDHAYHAVHPYVPVGGAEGSRPAAAHVAGDGERVGADLRALLAGVADPGVGQGIADHGGEGEVVEAADGAAEVLHGDVGGGEDEVDAVLVVDGEGLGLDGGGDDLLDGEAGEVGAVGVEVVGVLAGDEDGAGDIGAGLVGVEGDGAPPVWDGGGGGDAAAGGGDGEEEVLDEELVGGGPFSVPDDVDVDRRREDGAHVVPEVDEVGGALESLRGGEGSRWELRVRQCRL